MSIAKAMDRRSVGACVALGSESAAAQRWPRVR